MPTLYDDPISGNGFKVRLILALTGTAYDLVEVDILKGETRTPEFLARNPNGRIPTVVFEDGGVLAESNAILLHVAEGSAYLPEDARERAEVFQWLFWEQYNHEPNIATSRFLLQHRDPSDERAAELARRKAPGETALALMEAHLARRDFLVGGRFSVADIALYAYTHVAGEGGFPLDPYPAIRAWLARVEAVPGFVPMSAPPGGH
jgi:glutathione S-transferase